MNKKSLMVYMGDRKVGILAQAQEYKVAFEYDKEWIDNGFYISPISLPLQSGG